MLFRLLFFVAVIGAVIYVAPQVAQLVSPPLPTRDPAATLPPALASGIAGVETALKQAAQSGKSVPISLRMTDADLTAAAQPYFPQSYAGITVTEPAVRIGPAVTLTAKASSLGLSGPLVAKATPFATSDGKLALRLDSANVGALGLPDAARAQLQQQMQAALNAAIPTRLQVSTVTIAQGVATIGGTALP